MKNKNKKEKKFEDLTKQQKMIKEITIARIKQIPDNLKISIG